MLAVFQAVVPWHVEVEKPGHCQGLGWHRVEKYRLKGAKGNVGQQPGGDSL